MRISCYLIALLFTISNSIAVWPVKGQQAEGDALWQPYYVDQRTGEEHLSLNGDWQLGYRDTAISTPADLDQQKWLPAEVPDSVQWSLYRAGVLPYPYAHLNTRQYAWVPDKVWYYQRQFSVPAGAKDAYVFLCFDGAGYYSRIWLNGTLIGRHEAMFGGPHVEVSRWLKFGEQNQIIVEIKAGSYGVANWNPDAPEHVMLPWGSAGGSQYVTKASGIDPKEIEPLGLWQSVRLEITPKAHLERPFLITKKANAAEASLLLKVEVLAKATPVGSQLHPWKDEELAGAPDSSLARPVNPPLTLQLELAPKAAPHAVRKQSWPLKVNEGRNWVTESFPVPSPRLWWPNGMGDPNLYRATVTLLQGAKALDRIEFDYGIRTIERTPTPGPQVQDRWADWQFVVNGRPLFVKGVNWAWPLDVLLHLPTEKYRWLLEAAQAAHIQLIRVWGGGNPETNDFFAECDRLGILVWEDFPIGNEDTPGWPMDAWEAQVMQIIFRLRNHPSLAVWCGGNEFNPYDAGNTASVGIVERSVRDFDGTRMFLRTTPDPGDVHIYTDQDPTWYGHRYRWAPFISETGIYNMPEPQSLLEVVDAQELKGSFLDIFNRDYPSSHPEFVHHMLEYQGAEPRTLLSRATQMDDLAHADLIGFSRAAQMAAAEFTQILADLTQANYPVTAGLMPWSFTVPWPIEFFMFVDGLDQPTSSYYALKRSYEPTHVVVRLPQLIWAQGEMVPIQASVVHAPVAGLPAVTVSVEILDPQFHRLWIQKRQLNVSPGPSVKTATMGEFTIPGGLEDKFFFVVAEAHRPDSSLVSRSVYFPRCLALMSDPAFRTKYRSSPQPSLKFEHGPWLRPQVAAVPTTLDLAVLSRQDSDDRVSTLRVRVRNSGRSPAFDARVDIVGSKRAFYGTDNDLWLAPGEERTLDFKILWREPATRSSAQVSVSAWNAATREASMPPPR